MSNLPKTWIYFLKKHTFYVSLYLPGVAKKFKQMNSQWSRVWMSGLVCNPFNHTPCKSKGFKSRLLEDQNSLDQNMLMPLDNQIFIAKRRKTFVGFLWRSILLRNCTQSILGTRRDEWFLSRSAQHEHLV